MPLKPRITIITLAVTDLEKSPGFYRDGLGLPTKGIVGTEYEGGAVVFFNLKGGLTLALWPKKELAKDANVALAPASAAEFSIGHNVKSKEEVDTVMEQATKAGANITKPAQDTFWGGNAGYFQGPDGLSGKSPETQNCSQRTELHSGVLTGLRYGQTCLQSKLNSNPNSTRKARVEQII